MVLLKQAGVVPRIFQQGRLTALVEIGAPPGRAIFGNIGEWPGNRECPQVISSNTVFETCFHRSRSEPRPFDEPAEASKQLLRPKARFAHSDRRHRRRLLFESEKRHGPAGWSSGDTPRLKLSSKPVGPERFCFEGRRKPLSSRLAARPFFCRRSAADRGDIFSGGSQIPATLKLRVGRGRPFSTNGFPGRICPGRPAIPGRGACFAACPDQWAEAGAR